MTSRLIEFLFSASESRHVATKVKVKCKVLLVRSESSCKWSLKLHHGMWVEINNVMSGKCNNEQVRVWTTLFSSKVEIHSSLQRNLAAITMASCCFLTGKFTNRHLEHSRRGFDTTYVNRFVDPRHSLNNHSSGTLSMAAAVYRFSPYGTVVQDVRTEASVRIRIRIRLLKEQTHNVKMTSSVTMLMSHRGVRKQLPLRLKDRK